MSTITEHPHVVRDCEILQGEPIIKGTRIPVRAIVENLRLGYRPEELPQHLPSLNLAQIYDAISYFHDHSSEIERHIQENAISDEDINASDTRRGARFG